MPKYFYAAYSSMGLNFTYDSPCWMVHAFTSQQERDQFTKTCDNAETVDSKTAVKIAPELKTKKPCHAWRVVCH